MISKSSLCLSFVCVVFCMISTSEVLAKEANLDIAMPDKSQVIQLNRKLANTNDCAEIRTILKSLAAVHQSDINLRKNYSSKASIEDCGDLLRSVNKSELVKRFAVQVFSGHSKNKAMIAKYTLRDQGYEQAFHLEQPLGPNIIRYQVFSGEYGTEIAALNVIKSIQSKTPLMRYGRPYLKVKDNR